MNAAAVTILFGIKRYNGEMDKKIRAEIDTLCDKTITIYFFYCMHLILYPSYYILLLNIFV